MPDPRPLGAAAVTVLLLLSGCLGGSNKDRHDEHDEADEATQTTDPTETSGTVGPAYEDPVADFIPYPNPAVAGETVTFDASNSFDPEEGELSYSWSFGDGSSGSGIEVGHAYEEPGAYRVALEVTSDASNQTNEASLTVTILDAADVKQPVFIEDNETDGALDQSDIVGGSIFDSGGYLTVRVILQNLSATLYETRSVAMVAVVLNGTVYEAYGFDGELGVWDMERNGKVEGATVGIDEASDTVVIRLPLGGLVEKLPFEVHLQTQFGEPQNTHQGARVTDDRAPDDGEIDYGT